MNLNFNLKILKNSKNVWTDILRFLSLSLHVEGQASPDSCTLPLCPLCALKSLKLSLYTIPPLPFIFLSKVHPCPSPDGRFLPIKQWNIFINNFNEFSYSQISFYRFFIFLTFLILFFYHFDFFDDFYSFTVLNCVEYIVCIILNRIGLNEVRGQKGKICLDIIRCILRQD